MKKQLRSFINRFQSFNILRSQLIILAIITVHISSTDNTRDGMIDRIVQYALAYGLIYVAMSMKDKHN